MTLRLKLVLAAAGLAALALVLVSRAVCLSARLRYGIDVAACPQGAPRQTAFVQAQGLRRGTAGQVVVGALAHYTTGRADEERTAPVRGPSCSLALVVGGREQPLEPREGFRAERGRASAKVVLPDLPDGDYLLRARVRTRLGESVAEAPLPVYAPARVHVLTDRPLYQPGQTVRFRAVALRARDLAPLDARPGRWIVLDASGEALLEEKSPAGAFGVAQGSFPIDASAPTGLWTVRWASGDAQGEARFRVEPFSLPRFKVEAAPAKAFFLPGERPELRGEVAYSSGAPVSRARVELQWSHQGAWPPPTSWLERDLPREAQADEKGRFALALPPVPADLAGQATLLARLTAQDPAGDRVEGSAAVLLSQDAIQASAVTELGDGLSEGFNNRLFLRVADAAGAALPGAEVLVQRAWDPADPGVAARADEDAVAALQIDPGPPVNVVVPPMPRRAPPREPPVVRTGLRELVSEAEPPLSDLRALDDRQGALEPCTRHVPPGGEGVQVGLRVGAAGAVDVISMGRNAAAACVARALGALRLPPGGERLYEASYRLAASDLPELRLALQTVAEAPEELTAWLERTSRDARDCLPRSLAAPVGFPRLLSWRARAGSRAIALSFVPDPERPEGSSAEVAHCVEARFHPPALQEPAASDAAGIGRLRAVPSGGGAAQAPQAQVTLGYELKVTARRGGEVLGSTRLRLAPGAVPAVRLRASPILVEPGAALAVEVLRGPSFTGKLPEKLTLRTERSAIEMPVGAQTHTAIFAVPDAAQGFLQVEWMGARAIAYVRPRAQLSVSVEPERERYAPGQTARLRIRTRAGDRGLRAAVGLFGVDESLGQIAQLPGPDELASLRPTATVSAPAFDVLDARALALGRIRGANAAMATVLRVTAVPPRAEIDAYVNAIGRGAFDPLEELTDHFYGVLAELHARTRTWEEKAPAGERMHPATMGRLWKESLEACRARGEKVEDAYGRPLRLSQLPQDLLELADPRSVVANGTRLPEDVESWPAWVAKEEP